MKEQNPREILKKINTLDKKIMKAEKEIKNIELAWSKKKESIAKLTQEFDNCLKVLHYPVSGQNGE